VDTPTTASAQEALIGVPLRHGWCPHQPSFAITFPSIRSLRWLSGVEFIVTPLQGLMPLYNHFYNSSAPLGRYGVICLFSDRWRHRPRHRLKKPWLVFPYALAGVITNHHSAFTSTSAQNQIISVYIFVFNVNIVNNSDFLILILHNSPISFNK
jgi:hypothetical protein